MKTLILNGSPRLNGDTAALLSALKTKLHGDVAELSAYRDQISPCVDCRYCITHNKCSIADDMDEIYKDDYDNLIIASPVYYGNLTGPMISLASRLQVYHSLQPERNAPRVLKPKQGAVLLAGGGKANPERALAFSKIIFHILNVSFDEKDICFCFGTDTLPAEKNEVALGSAEALAVRLNDLEIFQQ